MNSEQRRRKIIEKLKHSKEPLSGGNLADYFNVSRQVIVQDIALIRAQGNEIIATARGYLFPKTREQGIVKTIAVIHSPEKMSDELLTIVELGGRIIDITVEHPIYGEITASLMLETKEDVENFYADFQKKNAEPLAIVTNGVHLHTIEVPSEKIYEIIIDALKEKDLLLES